MIALRGATYCGDVPPSLVNALTDDTDPALRPLPDEVAALLLELGAPPRLGAHLRAVHDVACQLLDAVARRWPDLGLDGAAVRFGAAVHDIGKVRHPAELVGPGSAHEPEGYELLLDRGVAEPLARFARTHADWGAPDARPEDLAVAMADKVWKGRREPELERLFLDRVTAATGRPAWEEFLVLDGVLDAIAEDAPARLATQVRYPVEPPA